MMLKTFYETRFERTEFARLLAFGLASFGRGTCIHGLSCEARLALRRQASEFHSLGLRSLEPTRPYARRNRSGYIFVEALVVVAGLVALMAMLAADERAATQQIQNRLRERRAEAAASAAVARATAVLQAANPNVVTLSDDWAQQGDSGNEEFDFTDGSASYRVQIVDAGAMLNLNTASQTQLSLLPLDQSQVDCLLDWRDTTAQPRPDGAKDGFYNALPQPYNTKLGPLTTVNELLLIDNWTAQTLYQAPTTTATITLPTDANGATLPLASMLTVDSGSPNTQVTGAARINLGARGVNVTALTRLGINQRVATQIAARAPYTTFRALFAVPGVTAADRRALLNAVTFTTGTRTTGKINLNTATLPILQTIQTLPNGVAASIVSQQYNGFPQLSALANVPGVTQASLGQVADNFTVAGDTWIVRAYGESGGVGDAVEAVVGFRNNHIQVVNRECINTTTIPVWWGWNAQPTSTIDAGASR